VEIQGLHLEPLRNFLLEHPQCLKGINRALLPSTVIKTPPAAAVDANGSGGGRASAAEAAAARADVEWWNSAAAEKAKEAQADMGTEGRSGRKPRHKKGPEMARVPLAALPLVLNTKPRCPQVPKIR